MLPQRNGAMALRRAPSAARHHQIWVAHWSLSLGSIALGAALLAWGYAPMLLWRFILGSGVAVLLQTVFIAFLRRRIGTELSTAADWLTLARAAAGGLLAGLVCSGVRDRLGLAGWLGCVVLLFGSTITDWLDGPLARRYGPTRLGAALDIEADSWITLWSGAAAVAWGVLPIFVLLAPLLHYAYPLRALLAGQVPHSDGVVWARIPGVAQMALFAAALLPIAGAPRDALLPWVAYPVALAQCLTMLVMLRQK